MANIALGMLKTTWDNTCSYIKKISDLITSNFLPVQITASIPAGTNNIGDVDIASALPTGTNTIGATINKNSSGTEIFTASNPGNQKIVDSTFAIKSAPVTGLKTATATVAEIFAGSSRLTNRYTMILYNDSSVNVYWGASGATTSTGFPLLPSDTVVFQFTPNASVPIYVISDDTSSVRVVELA